MFNNNNTAQESTTSNEATVVRPSAVAIGTFAGNTRATVIGGSSILVREVAHQSVKQTKAGLSATGSMLSSTIDYVKQANAAETKAYASRREALEAAYTVVVSKKGEEIINVQETTSVI